MRPPRPCLAAAFSAAIDRLGPFEPSPALAVAVSGGADSMALAVLAQIWARQREGWILALVVDHGLRPTSGAEARATIERLGRLGIPATLLKLTTLTAGPALAERARTLRYQVLTAACNEAGCLHLLLGHHAADQAETVAMRVLRGSQTHGLAGMAALRETASLRVLRPLLDIDPARLRSYLSRRGVGWIEDPSNRDLRALRPRLRHGFAARAVLEAGLTQAVAAAGRMRQREESQIAAELAACAAIRPEGFALLSTGRIGPGALSRLIQVIGGAAYPPGPSQLTALSGQLHRYADRGRAGQGEAGWAVSATLAGVRILPAGRLGHGLLVVREEAAIADPVEARAGMIWDNRYRVIAGNAIPDGATIGKLGSDAARVRDFSELPSAILRTLPALRIEDKLAAVPHIGYVDGQIGRRITVIFSPPGPAGGSSFMPSI